MIITIDGPAGVGKSTTAKLLAQKLHFAYFDTGAMYRTITWAILKNRMDLGDETGIKKILENFNYEIIEKEDGKHYFFNNEDITSIIRSSKVTSKVSLVSSKKYIREALVLIQRDFAKDKDVVCEGRDMGTVVFPDADLKIFLTAKVNIRAKRRFKELIEKFPQDINVLDQNKILKDIIRRDEYDTTREISPLKKAKDAYLVDTSNLTIKKTLKKILKKVKKITKVKLGYKLVIISMKFIFKILYRHKVYGIENYLKGSAIIVANHVSIYDPPSIAISCPEAVHFLAKDTLFKPNFFKKCLNILNTHPISAKEANISTFKLVKNLLKKKKKIVLFPEGTRSNDNKIQPILPGIAFLVNMSQATILPTYIHGTFEIWPRCRKYPKLFGRSRCVFGKPIKFSEFEHLDKKQRIQAIIQKIESSLNSLKNYCDEGFNGPIP